MKTRVTGVTTTTPALMIIDGRPTFSFALVFILFLLDKFKVDTIQDNFKNTHAGALGARSRGAFKKGPFCLVYNLKGCPAENKVE